MAGSSEPGPERDDWFFSTVQRQEAVVRRLAEKARSAGDALAWLGVERQTQRYLRNLKTPLLAMFLRDSWEVEAARHRGFLQRSRNEAQLALSASNAAVVAEARRQLGVRVAVVGKGGSGKSFVSATMARLLARQGRNVLAADLDTNPGMAFSIGVSPTSGALPVTAIERHGGAAYGWRLRTGLSPDDTVRRHSTPGPDRLRFLSLGKIDEPEKNGPKRTVGAVLETLIGFGEPSWDLIGDMEAGLTTPFERYHAFADLVLVVVGPAWRSAMTARRLLHLLDDLPTLVVGNQYRDETDHPSLQTVVSIPYDHAVAEAEREGRCPLDACLDSPAVAAVQALVGQCLSITRLEPVNI